jgi:hypothetical protein
MIDMTENVTHHNRTGYVNGCRCPICHDANNEYQREYRRHERKKNLPLGPMLQLFGDQHDTDIATLLGVTQTTFTQWKRQGIPLVEADRIVCSIGIHPFYVWGDAYWKAELS